MKKLAFILVGLIGACSTVSVHRSTEGKPLATIDDATVMPDEFIYAFNKNRPVDSLASKADIDEYLDLYIKFKLKVAEANKRGMDTTAEFIKEYTTYIDQLNNSYLQSGNDTEALINEAYNRLKYQVRASHILFSVEESASAQDTLVAYNKALAVLDSIQNGSSFESMAIRYSDDPSVKKNKGDLGYFTVFQMVYPFESAAFTTEVGKTSRPIRTKFGYHLIKVVDKRINEGKVKVAHIMIRKKNGDKEKAFEIYDQLRGGADWQDLCKQNSEDAQTVNQGGVLASFARNQIVPEFAEAAFSLTEPGEISDPVKTAYGWHIIKLIERIPVSDFETNRKELSVKVKRDSRSKISHQKMVERLGVENNFIENTANVQRIVLPENHKFLKNKWLLDSDTLAHLELFSINHTVYKASEYYEEIRKSTTHQATKNFLYKEYKKFKEGSLIDYEKDHLGEKYPDYNYLKREYHDGILLFSIMEDEVWAKAGRDSVGLGAYYESHKNNFIDPSKLSAIVFSSSSQAVIDSVSQIIPDKESFYNISKDEKEAILKHYNHDTQLSLQLDSSSYIISEHPALKKMTKPYTQDIIDVGNMWYFIIPLRDPKLPPPLEEIKGNLIADYQDELETKWLLKLTSSNVVEINEGVLRKVYKELEAE